MNTNSNRKDNLGCIATWGLIGLSIVYVALFVKVAEGNVVENWKWICASLSSFFIIICWIIIKNKIESKKENEIHELEKEKEELNKAITKTNQLVDILRSRTPFSAVAKMYADAHAVVFNEDIKLMIRRNNSLNTIQLNKKRKEEYIELVQKYQALEWKYTSLIDRYFREVRTQLQTEELFLNFLQTTSTKQYIELINAKIKQNNIEKNEAINRYKYQHDLLTSQTPFKDSVELITKLDGLDYDAAAYFLRYKSPPAPVSADKIEKEYKQEYLKWRTLYEELYSKYQFLCSTFPDLKLYIDDEKSLLKLAELNSFDDFQEETDRVANYVTQEEWLRLTSIQRNQLALDRYIQRDKDNLTIGLEYEMYAEYVLRMKGFKTIPHGIINGVNDLGRDIIAWKEDICGPLFSDSLDIFSDTYVYIIQCKLRSQDTVIHENVICQVYGSAIEYELEHPEKQAIPTICTNVPLSETAQKFAERLKVFVITMQMGEFPRIKCNINNGEKIYHLPFDQQYWRTQINKSGECYAWTIQEAEDKGFRRAMRHNPYTNN